jgi:SWI/SNF-related matrix-associated actin-dependent regulator of chromatin subfamily A-like protein 1
VSLTPYPLKGPWWALNIDLSADGETVSTVPGLSVNAHESRCEGLIDAIAAACHRLGRPLPPRPVPTPVSTPVKLHAYQTHGIGLIETITRATRSAILADDMGLGKTRQAIAWSGTKPGRVFVICPAFVRESWRAELGRLGEDSVAILGPQALKADKAEWEKAPTARWVVTSYHHGMMEKAYETAFGKNAPTVFIMDEAHRLRGRDAKRSAVAKRIGALATYRLMLTGTPMWSRPRDFYALLSILFGQRFGTKWAFDVAYCGGKLNDYGGLDNKGATNAEELKHRLSFYMVRRERRDVAHELPSLTRQVIWCDGNKEAEIAFHRALINKDPGATHEALLATHKAKVEAALDIAEQAKRFLLLTYRKSLAHQMAQELNDSGTPCVCITGEMATPERQSAVRQAAAAGHGIVATIDSIYEGVDGIQHVADIGIFHALDYVPLKMAQAEARLHRLGQDRPVTWYYLACKDSMDTLVVKTVVDKLDMARNVLGGETSRGMRDVISDSADMSDAGQAAALSALYDSL